LVGNLIGRRNFRGFMHKYLILLMRPTRIEPVFSP
jgi:hypothetical protein